MKKIVFFILAAALPLLGCAGGDCAELVGGKNGGLAVSFGTAAPTRAFFDGDPAGEPWEREIRTLEAIICDGAGNVLHRRQLNRTEIDAGKALFSEADLSAGGDYTIYLLANYDTSDILGGFEVLTDAPVSKYNGSYEQLRQGCADVGGFAMAVAGTLTAAHTLSNPQHLTLRRTVSKLELKITVGNDLSVYHPNGELEVTETVIDRIAANVQLFGSTGSGETSLTQTPFEQEYNHEYHNVCYLFTHETLIPEITLHAKFYPDGKAANPANFTEHTFNFSPEGGIAPNTYYRLQARITQLDEVIVPETYTVTYHPNGGEGSYSEVITGSDDYLILDPETIGISRAGYDFTGWNMKAEGTGQSYAADQWIKLTGDFDLYAQWSKPLPYTITFGRVPALAYLQFDKIYESLFTITPWPVEGAAFTIRAEREWGDRNYLDVFYNGVNILGVEVPVTDISASGTFTTKIRYSPPLVTYSIEPVRVYYVLKDNRNNMWIFNDDWNGKNALEIVTRWQGENLNCSTASTEAYGYQTDEGQTGWKTYLCSQGGFTLTAVPDAGYRFDGWYLDSSFSQPYSTLRYLGYAPTQSVFRLFPKVIKDDV